MSKQYLLNPKQEEECQSATDREPVWVYQAIGILVIVLSGIGVVYAVVAVIERLQG